jgi:asparagine synthase (glutamine-hydrolysing)
MCGILGYFNPQDKNNFDLNHMLSAQHHRGPDENGFWKNSEGLVLGHNRLSIQDLSSKASQPMESKKNNILVYNGEIYNHKELRKLFFNNQNFNSTGDTETLLRMIEKIGIDKTLQKINGMFAFCFYDSENNLLYMARDCFGEKPLYYGFQNNSFVFSSDLAAIKKYSLFENKINNESISLYLKYGNIPYPYSIYKNIFKLEPGKYIIFNLKNKTLQKKTFWNSVKQAELNFKKNQNINFQNSSQILRKKLTESIKSQLVSDVPIGAFLSSGIDSSLIVSIMQEISSKPINTFTIGFENNEFDEAADAKKISNFLGTNHKEYYFNNSDVVNFATNMNSYFSEPFSDSSQIPTYLVSKIASQNVKVCLTGDGGDELFGGYSRYIYINKLSNINFFFRSKIKYLEKIFINYTPSIFYKLINFVFKNNSLNIDKNKIIKLFNILNKKNTNEMFEELISNFSPIEIENMILVDKIINHESLDFAFNSTNEGMMLNDTINYLPNDILTKVDRASMSNSLETRLPFLSKEVYNFAWSLNTNHKYKKNDGKVILRDLLNNFLPKNLISNKKKGFAVPIDNWTRGPLNDWINDMFSKEVISKFNLLDYKSTQRIIKGHYNDRQKYGNKLWLIANLNSWLLRNL